MEHNSQCAQGSYQRSGDAQSPIVLYKYQPDRDKEHPKQFLDGFQGYLHANGYAAYYSLPEGITIVGCWAHAHRKFDEALKGISEKVRVGSLAEKAK